MKQKEIVTKGTLSTVAVEMIKEYLQTQTVNGITGFVKTEKEICDKYKDTDCFKEWDSQKLYAIYTINCYHCTAPHDVNIGSREAFHVYHGADFQLCHKCYDSSGLIYMIIRDGVVVS
ncbi:hypothetical protein H0I29_11235 [Polaribacter sp. R2A056_3_33]|uniref:hypothetical protein n=1 Tax=Polaribacter sp. R2A056_3_33 TaxID=2745563 RepID=UPI001C4EE749|nr:hypothetical protein [Polaribacter sp. R2A056_3_33]QXP69204.1 hypothetical protein H0I29_11235 [Polaribacter sp. R2A056_3_33]